MLYDDIFPIGISQDVAMFYRALYQPAISLRTLLMNGSHAALQRVDWPFIHVVNAGTRQDEEYFFPTTWSRKFTPDGHLFPLGFILISYSRIALVLGSAYTNMHIKKQPNAIHSIVEDLSRYSSGLVTLSGIMPSALDQFDAWKDPRLSNSLYGTSYMLLRNVREIEKRHFSKRAPRVAVVGCGRTGLQALSVLASQGYHVGGFDLFPDTVQDKTYFHGNEFNRLKDYSIVILLTGRGNSGIRTIQQHVKAGSVVLSDTHPKPSYKYWLKLLDNDVICYEAAATMCGSFFLPELPGWKRTTLPGCLLQAIVEDRYNKMYQDFAEFYADATSIGLVSRLDPVA